MKVAIGAVITAKKIMVDVQVKFEDPKSKEVFTVFEIDKRCDLILVVESDCGSVVTSDHKGNTSNRCVAEHTNVKESTKFVDTFTPALVWLSP
ncbi:hypothetical protein Plhal304r1_c107g0176041 [Plasmopara halstedii]